MIARFLLGAVIALASYFLLSSSLQLFGTVAKTVPEQLELAITPAAGVHAGVATDASSSSGGGSRGRGSGSSDIVSPRNLFELAKPFDVVNDQCRRACGSNHDVEEELINACPKVSQFL